MQKIRPFSFQIQHFEFEDFVSLLNENSSLVENTSFLFKDSSYKTDRETTFSNLEVFSSRREQMSPLWHLATESYCPIE